MSLLTKNIWLKSHLLIFIFFSILVNIAIATEDEKIRINSIEQVYNAQLPDVSSNLITTLDPTENFKRTQAVLNYFHVPTEENSQNYFNDLKIIRSYQEIQQIINWMDPSQFFKRLSQITTTDLSVFQDIDAKQVLDLSFHVRQTESTTKDKDLLLKGLKIAIDPGHMGSSFWDKQTGKYVHDDQGHIISEGILNLQTSLLLKNELEKLGAIVFLTHDDLKPVSNIDYTTFDIEPYALNELRDSIHTDWFQKLIATAPIGETLFKNFKNSTQVKNLFSENSRSQYFIKREDLWARSEVIDRFVPDIILIIHFDTADLTNDSSALNPKSPRQTKSFVVGSYEPTEFGSRESRKYFVRHLLDKKSWNDSIKLSRAIVGQLHKQLNLDLALSADAGSTVIEPGIFSRNLMVPRRLKASAAIAYLECLFYNRPDEFQMLRQTTHPLIIGGQNIPYSDRVQQVVTAIKDGVVQFVQK